MKQLIKGLIAVILPLVLVAYPSVAGAQTPPQAPPPAPPQTPARELSPWPKVTIRSGALLADVSSDVRIDGTAGSTGTNIDFQDDLGFSNSATAFFIEGVWRLSHRNRLLVTYERVKRDSNRALVERTITFGDTTFTAGGQIDAFFDTFYLAADYGYAFVANPTLEVGVSIGVTFLRIETGIGLDLSGDAGESVSRDLADNTQFDVPVPLPGFFLGYRPHPRWTIISGVRFIKATIGDYTGSFLEAEAGGEFKIGGGFGAGLTYYFNKAVVDRENSSINGRMEYTFNGPQAYVVWSF